MAFLHVQAGQASNVPLAIRGRVMQHVECNNTYHSVGPDKQDVWLHAGLDPHSCTATAAALAHWLSPPAAGAPPRSLGELARQSSSRPLADAAAAVARHAPGGKPPELFVFHAAPHKFAVLCCGGQAALLHSNQDDTRGGLRFTLQQHLDGGSRTRLNMTVDEAASMCRNLALAVCDSDLHRAVFNEYFGAPFCRGTSDSYWFVALPVTAALV